MLVVMQRDDQEFEKVKKAAGNAEISEPILREFVEAYREDFNEELALGEARVMLTQLVLFYLHISRPLPNQNVDI
jgi:hypothetical protein